MLFLDFPSGKEKKKKGKKSHLEANLGQQLSHSLATPLNNVVLYQTFIVMHKVMNNVCLAFI